MTERPPSGDPSETDSDEPRRQCQRTSKSRHATELHLSTVARRRCLGTGSTPRLRTYDPGILVAALYDVEGNLPALEAVLSELEPIDPDVILFGGDLFCGAQPVEVIDRCRSLSNGAFILGNADRLDEPNVAYMVNRLREEQRQFVASFPEHLVVDNALYRHGSPRSVDELVTALTPESTLREMVEGVEQTTIVIGHTHTQFDRSVDGYRIVNAGSVGAAWERVPGAYWALIGNEREVELRRTPYDVDAAIAALRPDHPNRETREAWIRGPHDPVAIAEQIEEALGRPRP